MSVYLERQKLLLEAIWISQRLIYGDYQPMIDGKVDGEESASNPRALRALARRAKGWSPAERRAALEEALDFQRAMLKAFERRKIWDPPSDALKEELIAEVSEAFPQFDRAGLEGAFTWGIIWYCK